MKKVWFFLLFLTVAAFSFAQEIPNRDIFIDGTALNPAQRLFFMENFRMEGISLGYNIVENRRDAGYTFSFNVTPNMIFYDDGSVAPAPPDEAQFVITVTLIRNHDNFEVVSFGFAFTTLDEMLEFNLYLFFRAVVNIPQPTAPAVAGRLRPAQGFIDDSWRDKWLYLRASLDFPMRFYFLQKSDDLVQGIGASGVDIRSGEIIYSPLDNRFVALPGMTLGVEVQFLDWLSVEPSLQISLGDPVTFSFVNLYAGAAVKYQFKAISDLVIAPYAAFSLPLNKSPVFSKLPFSLGAGLQLVVKAGNTGGAFLDLSFMHALGNAVMYNQLVPVFPIPETVSYQHFTVGIGFGYKFGLINRSRP